MASGESRHSPLITHHSPLITHYSGLIAGLLICLSARPAAAQLPRESQSGWELTPYRIQILVAWTPAPQLTPRLQSNLLAGLIQRTDALVGASWDVRAVPAPRYLLGALHAIADDTAVQSLWREKADNRDLAALAEYLDRLAPGEALTLPPDSAERIARGRKIFFSTVTSEEPGTSEGPGTGCANCHRMPLGTDSGLLHADGQFLRHDVGTSIVTGSDPVDAGQTPPRRETPMLFGLRKAKAFLHHGRAESVEEVFTKFNPEDKHGRTSHLNSEDAGALAEFVRYIEPPELDKVILLAVSCDLDGPRVTARELDLRTQLFSPPVSRPVRQPGKLRDVALGAIVEAFAPVARIEDVVGKDQVLLRLKAAALPCRDARLSFVHPGDTFRPVVRRNDRDGNIGGINAIEWTYLLVQQMDEQPITCRLLSGFAKPLSSRRRGRIEMLALRVVPPGKPSTLLLRSRSEDQQPLAGYDVYSHPPGVKTTVLLGRTDRRGELVVRPAADPLRVLLIRNGTDTLARLPIVPGLQPTFIAPLANDDQRLEVEGFITGLQEKLVDVVTRREVLLIRARARIEQGKLPEATKLIDELHNLQTADNFRAMLTKAKKQSRYRAGDPVRQAKIEILFRDTRILISKHLDAGDLEEISQDLRKASQAVGS